MRALSLSAVTKWSTFVKKIVAASSTAGIPLQMLALANLVANYANFISHHDNNKLVRLLLRATQLKWPTWMSAHGRRSM